MTLKQMLEKEKRKSKPRRRRLSPPTPSKRAEVWYRKQLTSLVDMMLNIIDEEMKKQTLNDAKSDDSEKLSISARLSRAINRLSQIKIAEIAQKLSLGMIKRTNEQNKRQTQSTYQAAFGIDLTNMLSDEVVSESLKNAITENVNLIKSIQTDFINDIGEKVFTNLSGGGRHENLTSLIRERGKVAHSRAKLIARDQTAKLNSALTEQRAASLGVDLYEWGGAGDERQREKHSKLNRMICKYSDPTVYSADGGKTWKKRKSINAFEGKPGEDFQCRCVAIPYIAWD